MYQNMGKLRNITFALLLLLLIVSLCINVQFCNTKHSEIFQDTLRTTFVDTIPYLNPVPKDSLVIRYITQRLPIVDDTEVNVSTNNKNDEQNISQSGNNVYENILDSADVVIPITQKVYEDSPYKAYVSGYNASLDSFLIYPRNEVITIRQKTKRWNIGVQAGYGVTPKGFMPYVGFGVSITLF